MTENEEKSLFTVICDLFLSLHTEDVRGALEQGVASASLMPSSAKRGDGSSEIRFAFDGDAVLFSDESERVYKEKGLEAFTENEKNACFLKIVLLKCADS